MGEIFVPPMGGGGVSSDELTATKQFVLKGMTAVTKDSNDETGVGTMPDYRNLTKESDSMWIDGDYVHMSVQDWGCYGAESSIRRPASDLGDAINSRVLEGNTYSSKDGINESGTMPDFSGKAEYWASAAYVSVEPYSEIAARIIIPNIQEKTGFYDATSKVIGYIKNLLADNIKANVLVGKSNGDETNCIKGTFTSDGTAVAGDIVKDKTGYVNGEKVIGTLTDNSGTTKSAEASLDTTNSRVQLTVPATAKYNTSSKLYVAFATLASKIGLTSAKLISGNTILGIAGTATSDATIGQATQLRKGVIAYGKNGVKYTGTMTEQAAKTWTPGTSAQTIAAGTYCSGVQTIAAIPSNYVDLSSAKTVFNNGQFPLPGIVSGFCPCKVYERSNNDYVLTKTSETFDYANIAGHATYKTGMFAHSIDLTKVKSITATFDITHAEQYDSDEGDTYYYLTSGSAYVEVFSPTTLKSVAYKSQGKNTDGNSTWYKGDVVTVTLDTSGLTGYHYVAFTLHRVSVSSPSEYVNGKLRTVVIA